MMKNLLALLVLAMTTAISAAPQYGGTYIHARSGDSVGLDPSRETDGESIMVCDNIYDSLVRFKSGTTIVEADLASKWNISEKGTQYDFTLRKGVKFHDGTVFNADAVLTNFNRQRDKSHPYFNLGPYVYWDAMGMNKIVKDITKISDYKVRFTLHQAEAPFLANMAMHFAQIVSPAAMKKYGNKLKFNPVGTGPFKFKKWVKKQMIVLEANKEYWGGRPYLDKLVFKAISDPSSRFLEMLSGKVHSMDNPNLSDVKKLTEDKSIKLLKQAALNIGALSMQNQRPPFNKPAVRQAVNLAINKKAIIDNIYHGFAEVAKNPMPPTIWGYNDEVNGYEYNPKKAKEMLTAAGYPEGFKTTLNVIPVSRPYMPNGQQVAEAIQADLAKVGITVKLVRYDWANHLKRLDDGNFEMALMGWNGDNGDPDNFLHILLDKNSSQNSARYDNAMVNLKLKQAKEATKQSDRAKLYKEVQSIVHSEAPWVNIAHSTEILPMKKIVQDYIMDPLTSRRFSKVWLSKEKGK